MFNRFSEAGIEALEQVIIEHVDRNGCHINWIFEEDDDLPPYAYSIGFPKTISLVDSARAASTPEVVIFGLPQETAGPAINGLLAMCAAGLSLHEGARIPEFFGVFDCIVRMVDKRNLNYFESAKWYHESQMGQPLENVAMIVWPDADHRFPWEPECADWVKADQLPLYDAQAKL